MPSPAVDHLASLRRLALERAGYIRARDDVMARIREAVTAAGLAGLTHSEIIEASGLSRRTVYKYLPPKGDHRG